MAEDVARAVGAGSGETITIAGKECQVRPLGIKELTEVERECVSQYKREYLRTFSENLDLLPEEDRSGLLISKMDEAARWDVSDLPTRYVFDPTHVMLTPELRKWLKDNIGFSQKDSDGNSLLNSVLNNKLKQLAASALDSGMLDENSYEQLVGDVPTKVEVSYVNWWISGNPDGMLTLIWVCFRNQGITKDEISTEMGPNSETLIHVSREIERLSAPDVGNG